MSQFGKMLVLSLLSGVALLAQAGDFDRCSDQFVNGRAPKVVREHPGLQRALCFDGFAILHSGESKTPIYVAERLTYQRLKDSSDEKRTDRFYEEARLPSAERAKLADYAGSGFHRGHMAPAFEMETPSQMAQSFSLANMVPQAPKNNTGAWKRVEMATRHYVKRTHGEVYVLTGPIYQGTVKTIGRGNVWVPTKLFKLVYDPVRRTAWAHVVDNHDKAKVGKPISYEELVKMTGIDLLPGA